MESEVRLLKFFEQVNNINVYFMKIDNTPNVFSDLGCFELVGSTTGSTFSREMFLKKLRIFTNNT